MQLPQPYSKSIELPSVSLVSVLLKHRTVDTPCIAT